MSEIRNDILMLLVSELHVGSTKLDMQTYIWRSTGGLCLNKSGYSEALLGCNTTCCIVGLVPKVDPYFASCFVGKNGAYRFVEMSLAILGREGDTSTTSAGKEAHYLWMYCFGSFWDNDRAEAIKRLNYVIENGTYPDSFIPPDTID